ncbi:putative Sulfotransferase domain-containing protein 5, partial [Homarus americanus]
MMCRGTGAGYDGRRGVMWRGTGAGYDGRRGVMWRGTGVMWPGGLVLEDTCKENTCLGNTITPVWINLCWGRCVRRQVVLVQVGLLALFVFLAQLIRPDQSSFGPSSSGPKERSEELRRRVKEICSVFNVSSEISPLQLNIHLKTQEYMLIQPKFEDVWPDMLASYRKFLFIRHPFHRVVSAYRDKMEVITEVEDLGISHFMKKKISEKFGSSSTDPEGVVKFEEFWLEVEEEMGQFPVPMKTTAASSLASTYLHKLNSTLRRAFVSRYILDYLSFNYD